MEIEELEFEMVSLAKDFVSQKRTGEAGLKVMVRMMINKVIESKLHQPTVISSVCDNDVSGCVHPLSKLVSGDEGLFCCKCQKYVRSDAHIH